MNRFGRLAVALMLLAGFAVPRAGQATHVPACGGVAPQTGTCSNGPHDMAITFVSHGFTVAAFTGRLRSTVSWTLGSFTGSRTYYCDFRDTNDYVQGDCSSSGFFPPDCVEFELCHVRYTQRCKASAYRSDSGQGSGGWSCYNAGV